MLPSGQLAQASIWAGARLGNSFGLLSQVVDQDVIAEALRVGEKRATAVDAGDVVDEAHEPVAPLEHEGVDPQALAGTAAYLEQRLLQRARRWWIRKDRLRVARLPVRRWLAVGDHHDLSRPAFVARQQLAGVHQAVLEVGSVLPLAPAQRRQLLRLDLPCVQREGDQVQV